MSEFLVNDLGNVLQSEIALVCNPLIVSFYRGTTTKISLCTSSWELRRHAQVAGIAHGRCSGKDAAMLTLAKGAI